MNNLSKDHFPIVKPSKGTSEKSHLDANDW